jgi:hypothetical protein
MLNLPTKHGGITRNRVHQVREAHSVHDPSPVSHLQGDLQVGLLKTALQIPLNKPACALAKHRRGERVLVPCNGLTRFPLSLSTI